MKIMFKGQCVNSFLEYHLCIRCEWGRCGACLVQKEGMATKGRISPHLPHPMTERKLVGQSCLVEGIYHRGGQPSYSKGGVGLRLQESKLTKQKVATFSLGGGLEL